MRSTEVEAPVQLGPNLTERQSVLTGRLQQLSELQTQGHDVAEQILEAEAELMEIVELKADVGRLFRTNIH